MILSIDLAARRYQDIGIALLSDCIGAVRATLVSPASLNLAGAPNAGDLAHALHALATRHDVRLILIDGPQAWRADDAPNAHMRACERATRTPGKTGLPGIVKPASWTRMATYSYDLFDRLDALGWPRLGASWHGERAAIESFPTHAWRSLGHPPLPGKRARLDIAPWCSWLEPHYLGASLGDVSHDELQAVIAGLAGLQMIDGGIDAVARHGEAPFRSGATWREGFIVSPRRSAPNAAE